jgi:hypothetical protein
MANKDEGSYFEIIFNHEMFEDTTTPEKMVRYHCAFYLIVTAMASKCNAIFS